MIRYFTEDIDFAFKGKSVHSAWLKAVSEEEGRRPGQISVIFCSDPYLLEINRKYLGHDYYTDIITFDYSEGDTISGDLFISVDTVRSNAEYYSADFKDELDRVIVHGVLHLIGYDDHTDEQSAEMRARENHYLERRPEFFK
ncbi:MAG: rRNA maturation RNase YbeY [Bacteroidetes bacterium]|uniref:Endoribonuclease YbeY n=1 Tax=Candidatus Cryptobacteroides avistercoris TaxID=2840758 RepID=A0A9D9IYE9_9BACT|nr:rRNA maturation RNase YbeY [Candidatus Cryptobacteroides avistercoris]